MSTRSATSGGCTTGQYQVHMSCPDAMGYPPDQSVAYFDVPRASCDYSGFSGVDIPNYHRRKNNGELLPMTPFSQYFVKGGPGSFNYVLDTNGDGFSECGATPRHHVETGTGHFPVSHAPSLMELEGMLKDVDSSYHVQQAASRIYAKNFDLLTFAGEFRQTARMFTQMLPRLSTLLQRMWRNNDLDRYKQLSNAYLEARYGWRPLYYEMISLQKSLEALNSTRMRYSERVGSDESDSSTTSHTATLLGNGHLAYDVVDTISIGKRGSIVADIKPPSFRLNPVTTAWELTTLSFVVDWFYDVGTFLEAMSFLAFKTAYSAAGGKSITLQRSAQGNIVPRENFHYYQFTGSGTGAVTYEAEYVVRSPTSVSLNPHFTVNLDELKVLDALALVIQRIRN